MSYWCCSDCFSSSLPQDWSQCLKNPSLKCHYCGSCPLDEAISSRAPDDVILKLFAGNKDASTASKMEENGGDDLRLHKAMKSKCSGEVILALVVANKGSAMKESADGELPLHQALKNGYSDTIVMSILSAFPCGVMIRCKVTGMLPLHLAAASSASPWLVEALIKEYPEALEIVANGATPRDLVTAALPVESIKRICRPSLFGIRNVPSIQQHVPFLVEVPAAKARDASREIDVASLTQLSNVCAVKAQVHPKCNRTEPKDWISNLSQVSLTNAQGHPKYNDMELEDRVSKPSDIYSANAQVYPSINDKNPEDQVSNLSKVSAKDQACCEYNNTKSEDRVSTLSEVDSMKAQALSNFHNMEPENRDSESRSIHLHVNPNCSGILPIGRVARRIQLGLTGKGFPQLCVQHDYHDHSKDASWMEDCHHAVKHQTGVPHFPQKLHELLDSAGSSVISWQPHGRAFKIHNVKEFVERVLHIYFCQSKLESFQRQLNLYGFLRITQGRDKGAYYHELFLRGKYFLVDKIRRQRVKGTIVKPASNPETEPDFYSMPFVFAYHVVCVNQVPNTLLERNPEIKT